MSLVVLLGTLLSVGANDPTSGEIDGAVRGLIEGLQLSAVEALHSDAHLAVGVTFDPSARRLAGSDLERLLNELILAELQKTGFREAIGVRGGANLDGPATLAGAEWLVVTSVGDQGRRKLRLRTELRSIDRGLWAPSSDLVPVYAMASRALPIDDSIALLLAPRPDEPLSRATKPKRVARLSGRVLALEACELDGKPGAELIAIAARSVFVFLRTGDGVAPGPTLDFAERARATQPVRDPLATIVCDGSGRFSVGHSSFRSGLQIGYDAGRLSVRAELPGLPLAKNRDGRWILGRADAGTSRWSKRATVWQRSGAQTTSIEMTQSLVEITSARGRLFGLASDNRVVALDDALRTTARFGTSGAGISAFEHDAAVFVVGTSSASDGRDALRFVRVGGGSAPPPLALDGPVFATATAEPTATESASIFFAVQRTADSELFEAKLEAPP